jgi:Zn-dependent peptidase ImmA (M78 family)
VPVDVEAIARGIGVDVRLERLEDEVSGMLLVRDGNPVIGVNARHHPHRQRFTLAHEIGHYALHRHEVQFFLDAAPVFYRKEGAEPQTRSYELAANAFAAALLMPETSVCLAMEDDPIDVLDDRAVKRMADRFAVSSQALMIRLTELDLLFP